MSDFDVTGRTPLGAPGDSSAFDMSLDDPAVGDVAPVSKDTPPQETKTSHAFESARSALSLLAAGGVGLVVQGGGEMAKAASASATAAFRVAASAVTTAAESPGGLVALEAVGVGARLVSVGIRYSPVAFALTLSGDTPQAQPAAKPQPKLDFDTGPNGERPLTVGFLPPPERPGPRFVVLAPQTKRADESRPVASADKGNEKPEGPPAGLSPRGAESTPGAPRNEDEPAPRFPDSRYVPGLPRVDPETHIGRRGHESGYPDEGGVDGVLVAHAEYVTGEGTPAFVVPRGAAVTLLRPGVPALSTMDSIPYGHWDGISHLVEDARAHGYELEHVVGPGDDAQYALDNGGMHPYFEGAATYLPGAAVPDYLLQAPSGMSFPARSYSLGLDDPRRLSQVVLENSGHLSLFACADFYWPGSNETIRHIHESPGFRSQFDLPGLYVTDERTGKSVPDPATTERLNWDWRNPRDE